jgi:tRNA (cmo5U34)-methyltransferase
VTQDESSQAWGEADSQHFISAGKVHIPERDWIQESILDLMPAQPDEPFLAVELGTGSGWLSEAILDRFLRCRVVGLDPSPVMRREAAQTLQRFRDRAELRPFHLQDRSWLDGIGSEVRCFVSSLVIHHLDGGGKRQLYRDLHQHLEDGGAVLIADLVAPVSERELRYMADRWNAEVRRQSLALTGSPEVYQRFVQDHSNWFEHPDPGDTPSTVPEHLTWLSEAGFVGVDVFWARAGHALYGGYKGTADPAGTT